jgi:phosphate transport system substrate-binding protein
MTSENAGRLQTMSERGREKRISLRRVVWPAAVGGLLLAAIAGACGGGGRSSIVGDGSSTVFPITEAVAEEFGGQSGVQGGGISGTGGGFEVLPGETDFNDASAQ